MRARFPSTVLKTLMALSAALMTPSLVEASGRPAGSHRVVRVFDFEERAITTEPVPRHWVRVVNIPDRVERPGFPTWNEAGFDGAHASSGSYAVKLPTRGGSTALRLAAGVVPVVPQADYTVSASVRTEGLRRARGRLIARFLDAELKQIAGSQQSSPLLQTGGPWREVSVNLWGDFPEAAWVQIDLLLLQPNQQDLRVEAGDEDLVRDDLRGAVWFDDVAIMQIPRLELTTNSPTNVIHAPDRPVLRLHVRDLTGDPLRGEIVVFDLDGRPVATHRVDLPPASPTIEWAPPLTRFGWNRAQVRVTSRDQEVGAATLEFVWAPTGVPDPADAPRLAIIADREPLEQLPMLPSLLDAAGAGGVLIALSGAEPEVAFPPLEHAVLEALEQRFRVALQISRVTASLARRLHIATDDVLALPLEPDSEAWTSFIEPVLARFGQRVSRWQIGASEDDHSRYEDIAERRVSFQDALSRLSPDPIITSPWSAYRAFSRGVAEEGSLTIELPPAVHPDGIEPLVRSWDRAAPDADVTLVVTPAAADPRTRARSLAVRTLRAWGTSVDRVAFRAPWAWSDSRRPAAMPGPEFAVYRSLATRLHSRRVVGRAPMPDGAHALLLSGARGGMVALWNEYADPDDATLRVDLGDERVRAYDLFGNEIPIHSSRGRHFVRATRDPVFIENVDLELIEFQANVRIEPGFMVSRGARRTLDLVVTNPWPEGVTGRVRLTGEEHWRLAPRVQPLVVDPGQTVRLPFELSLGVSEEAGSHPIEVEAEIDLGRERLLLTLEPTIEIGVENLSLEGGVRIARSGNGGPGDVVIVAIVTNLGSEPVTMTVSALAPGKARQQAPVSALAPGNSAVRQFRYAGAAGELSGTPVRLSVIEAEGAERLNRTLEIP